MTGSRLFLSKSIDPIDQRGLHEFRSPRGDEEHDIRPRDPDDLGVSASNRAVGITLAVGIGMMLLILMLPYIGG